MKRFFISGLLLIACAALAEEPAAQESPIAQAQEENYQHLTPQQIQQQLDEAEALFKRAQEMFNPWYTGPLITPSATHVPVGLGVIQPLLLVQENYAAYNADRRSISLPHRNIFVFPLVLLQFGVTQSLDVALQIAGQEGWQDGHSGGGYADTAMNLGFLIQQQGLYIPGVKFSIQETCPTGRYQNLSTNGLGLGGVGGGAWQTQFTLSVAKLFFWMTKHPLNTRFALAYKIPTTVHVKGFNAYGGGFGTHGTVRPGNTFKADVGLEISLNQHWVIANDIVYTAQNETTFSGAPGTTAKGGIVPASVGGGYSDNLSLAPALEYNWGPNFGAIGGIQFSVYGRNSSNFINGQFSVYWAFPV